MDKENEEIPDIKYNSFSEVFAYYDIEPSTYSKWKTKGGPNDVPPISNPAKMLLWWRRHYRIAPSWKITAAVARQRRDFDSEQGNETGQQQAALASLSEQGLDSALERARAAEAISSTRFNQALRSGNDVEMERWKGVAHKNMQALHNTEKVVQKIRQDRKLLLPRVEVAAAWVTMINHIPRVLRKSLYEVRPEGIDALMWTKTCNEAVDRAFARVSGDLPDSLTSKDDEQGS